MFRSQTEICKQKFENVFLCVFVCKIVWLYDDDITTTDLSHQMGQEK